MIQEELQTKDRLQGVLSRVRFQSDDGTFSVAEVEVPERVVPVTVVGNLLSSRVGESVEIFGSWREDPRYGKQFQVDHIEAVLPSTSSGIERYLASDLMPGIGPTLARRLVGHFGEKTLDIIEHHPRRIQEVNGIGEKRAEQILEAWEEGRRVHRIMVFLRSHGVSAAMAVKIHRRYGAEAVDVMRRDPYRLVEEIRGVGFRTADGIARHMGIEADSPERLRAGLVHVLHSARDDGHLYLPWPVAQRKAQELMSIDDGMEDILEELRIQGKVVVEREPLPGEPDAVYTASAYHAEESAAGHLSRLMRSVGLTDDQRRDHRERLSRIEERLGMTLAGPQAEAVLSVFGDAVTVITGGPGTGKTTIVQALCELADELGRSVSLAAPTGRAARRLAETTGRSAQTIHRLLEYSFQAGGFQYDEDEPLPVDLLVVDEASMIDVYLLHALVRALPTGAGLVLVGDIDQLPSVGPGQVLADLIDSGAVGVTRLTEIFRQAKTSTIVLNAHRINAGEPPRDAPREDGELVDFYTIHASRPSKAQAQIVELATRRIPEAFGFDARDEIQILSPMYRGEVGCDHLNAILQEKFCGDDKRPLKRGNRKFFRGDRVMQTSNNYDTDVFNGDIGRVLHIDHGEKCMSVDFDGRQILYKSEDLDQLVLAYAITVHKSQGSEYPAVIIPVVTQHSIMLQRNLLYTAVTRGRRLVVLVGTPRAVGLAVGNARASLRYTGLARRLRV